MKKTELLPTSDHAKRVAGIMRRKLTTRWSEKEVKAFRSLLPIDEDDLAMLERYYRWHWPPVSQKNILRHDLGTLLNNFQSECDRGRIWCEAHPINPPMRKIIPLPRQSEPELSAEERAEAAASFEALMGRAPRLNL